jgi:Uma2 family endonuclease
MWTSRLGALELAKRVPMHYMTEEEYLLAEESASVRREYVDGHVFAMTGATDAHNLICGNVFALMHGYLRGTECRAYYNDMKVRIQSTTSFYYPDIMVSCEPFEAKNVFKSSPVLLLEVLSPSTKHIDRREKLVAYQKIASLREYVIVDQDRKKVEVYSRQLNREWEFTVVTGEQHLMLESLPNGPLSLSLSAIYEGYEPPSRVQESESSYET